MSARAASRLATLGFTDVYRYQTGKADWFAAGLPHEGAEAHVPRVADVAEHDVATCGLHERVGDLQERVRAAGRDVCVVIDADRIVLGIVNAEALRGDPATVVESIMKPDPVTFRPHLRTGEIPDYVRKRRGGKWLISQR